MPSMLWRTILAVIAVVLFWLILPPLLRVLGLDALNGDLLTILKVCIGGLALFYIIKGPPFPV